MDAKTIAETAAALVSGERALTHGEMALNFANIAEMWNAWWRVKSRGLIANPEAPFTAADVGTLMELLKIARRYTGETDVDNYIDAAGYAACTGEIATQNVKAPERQYTIVA